MAKAKQEEGEHRTQIVVAIIAAAGVIIAGAFGVVTSFLSGRSNGHDNEGTTVYVTSVSTTNSGSSPRTQALESVIWKFTGTVQPSPGGYGAVFVLGKTEDGSQSVNSDPVSIDSDGAWVAMVGPIPADIAWRMKWIATYGVIGGLPYARRIDPPDNRPLHPNDLRRVAVTEIPQEMLPPPSP